MAEDNAPNVIHIGPPDLPDLSDYTIGLIHAGLEIPNEAAIRSMAREIRKWRGISNPDAI